MKAIARRAVVAGLALAMLVAGALPASAAAGHLDTSFGGDGKVTTDMSGGFDAANAVAVQADGKIVAAGEIGGAGGRFGVARYDTDGALDTTFGGDGIVRTNFTKGQDATTGVAIQSDGKILVVGHTSRITGAGWTVGRFAVARYDTDGTLDTTFGGDGKVTTHFPTPSELPPPFEGATGVAIQGDGKIVAGGVVNLFCSCSRFGVARYDTDGTLDTTFGGDGLATTHFRYGSEGRAVAIAPGGAIVVVGGQIPDVGKYEVARFATDGTLDTTFSGNGKTAVETGKGETIATSVAIQSNARIVVGGYTDLPHEFGDPFGPSRFALVRLLTDGTLDTSFSTDGIVRTRFGDHQAAANGVAIQADGAIVAAGSDGDFALARYTPAGVLDTSFGGDGRVETPFGPYGQANAVVVQPNGKIVAAGVGLGRFALARYRSG